MEKYQYILETEEERDERLNAQTIEERKTNYWRGFKALLTVSIPLIAYLMYTIHHLVMTLA